MVEASTRLRPIDTNSAMMNICKHLLALEPHQPVDLARGAGQGDHAHHAATLRDRRRHREDGRTGRRIAARVHAGPAFLRRGKDRPRQTLGIDRGHVLLARAQDKGNAVPDPVQEIGDDCRTLVTRARCHYLRRANGLGDQRADRIEDKGLDPRRKVDALKGARHVDAALRHRFALAKLRLEDLGDKLRLGHQRRFALDDKTVAERVHEQNPRHQDHQRQKVEDDDLARQGRAVERHDPAPPPIFAQRIVGQRFRRNPVFAQKDVPLLGSRGFGWPEARQCRHSSL